MKERDKHKHKHLDFNQPIWKLQDDYSGFPVYSYQVVTDYRGLITKRSNEDKQPEPEKHINHVISRTEPWWWNYK